MRRADGRGPDALRPVRMHVDFTENPLASVLCEMGRTRVLCTVSEDLGVPRWLAGGGRGWVTAEYSLLPGSTDRRTEREATRGKVSGRTQEIQRLIGRSLRAVTALELLGERQIIIDCDVLQADGGTRCASITGAYVALALGLQTLKARGALMIRPPLTGQVAAVSVGMAGGRALLDLCYEEDSKAGVDMNIIRTDGGRYIELQGTAESTPFTRADMDRMMALADAGIDRLVAIQRQALAGVLEPLVQAAAGTS